MEKSPRSVSSSRAESKPVDSARLNSARLDKAAPSSARAPPDSSRSGTESARPMDSSRTARSDVPISSRSNVPNSTRSNLPDSSRSNVPSSSRSNNPATMDTARTYMDTGRVHTALAALGAEKQALLAKLQQIDYALESGSKKKASLPRPRK